jgi:hypothetical protein
MHRIKTKNMKRNISIYILALAAILITSCNENFLDLTNESQLSSDSFWKTKAQAEQAVIATYASLQTYSGDKWTFFEELWTGMNYKGDDIDNNPAEPYGREIANFTVNADNSNILNMWRTWYSTVGRANQVIQRIPEMSASELSDDDRNQYLGEARFLRGLAYMYLVVYFENIPLVTTFETDETKLYPSQAEPAEVWELVISDFLFASQNLPLSYDEANTGRATSLAAKAFLGKAYLATEQWTLARDMFGSVVNDPACPYDLVEKYEEIFDGSHENGVESVFEIQFSADRSNGNDERVPLNYEGVPYELGGWELFYPTQWIVNELKTDLTEDGKYSDRVYGTIFFDDPNSTMYNLDTEEWISFNDFKELGGQRPYYKKFSYAVDRQYYIGTNLHLMRFADLLLMYAEALNETNQTTLAISVVNRVRERSHAAPLPLTMNQSQLRTKIRHHERPAELSMEMGIRWFDLYRWAKGNSAKEPAKTTLLNHGKPFASNYTEPKNDIFPIPSYEKNTNHNLEQNPGY